LPCHGGETDQIRADFQQDFGDVFFQLSALAYQIDDLNLMLFVDIAADTGDTMTRHVNGGFMNDQRRHIGHRHQYNFHKSSVVFIVTQSPQRRLYKIY